MTADILTPAAIDDTSLADATALVERLRGRGVVLSLDDTGNLSVRAPKGTLGDDDRQSLLRHKAALVHILSGRVVAGDFPLTDIQQAYWVGRRSVELGGVGCHAYREFHRVDLDVDRLQAAWAQLIRRHGMLRCVIGEEGRQRILHEPPEYRFAVTDLSDMPDDVASARLATLRDEMSHHAFDPSVWPMFDIRITRLADGWRIHMGMDLLIADAASMLTLYREWGALYDNPDAALPPLVRKFADFVLHGGPSVADQQRAASYWRKRLDDLPGPPDLPLAKSPSEIAKPRFTRHSHTLSPDRWQALKQRARSHGLTPSALLAAAYGDVLAAWSRHQHFLITLTAFRAPPDFANVVGDFTSTILLEIDGRPARFVDRARKTQQRLAEDLEHDGWSGVAVARELARHTGRMIDSIPVVFTSALGRHAGADSTLPIAWLGETVHAITQTPQVWMDHHVIEDGDALIVSWDAVEELFHPGDIARMFAAYTGFLNDLADDDRHWQASLGRHVPKDQLALRQTVNDTAAPLPTGLLHQAILDVAAQSPDRVAIIAPDRSLTFAELIGHAAAVARQVSATLSASGVTETRDRLVGVAIAKGWRQVVAVLGVMMAGAAYLPVDPTLPSARRRYLVENGELACVLGEPANAGLDWPDGVPVLLVDDIAPLPADMATAGPAGAGDLAYVIYTSGSTGEPKGVMIEHQAALNTVLDINRRFGISGDSVVLGLSSLSFDLSVYDIFGVLGAGGRLVLPAADRLRDPGHWLDAMRRHGVTVWNTAPALLSMLVEHCGGEMGGEVGPDLKTVMLSGDWIPLGLPARIKAMAPNATVWALGGATEASIWSNWFEVRRIGDDWRSIPYGWPLTNQFYQILNDVLEPVPVGVTARLFIGGHGLARGYWRDPARTAARFITHPVSGARLYETGDLARYLPDGAIEFLGREDSQVKINGHRIEPGEIEAALASHPDVRQAVVVAVGRSGPGHERRLAAYVVTDDKSEAPQPSTESTRGPAPIEAGALLGGPSRLALLLSQPARRAAGGVRVALTGDVPPATTRRTVRQFSPAPVPLAELGRWLAALRSSADPASPLPRYRYASAGSSYAVQVWLLVKPGRVEGLEGGLYYHHPERHDLEYCGPAVALDSSSHAPANRAAFDSAAFSVCLVACYPAIRPLYGELARDFCLIEAGYMGQLLMDQAARGGLGLCAIGAFDSSALAGPLELGEERELLHSFVGGLPARGDEIPTSPGTQVATDITGELRGWLADRLPSYMIPDAILRLAALPVTANGKLDRARLPDPGLITERRQQQTEAAQPPVGGLEEVIAAVFCTVLDRSSVGRDQPVFDLGGTSVHMVRIHRRLTEQLGRSFDIVDLFRYPTVAGLAAWLGRGDGDGGGDGAPGLSGSGAGAASGAARAAARRNLRDRRGMA